MQLLSYNQVLTLVGAITLVSSPRSSVQIQYRKTWKYL